MKAVVWPAISLALWMVTPTDTADTYLGARWDADAVLVTMRDHRQLVVAKDAEQVGLEQAAVSSDQSAVGWLATYPNCCTSYPIPLKLVIYARGKVRTFSGNGLPVWRWCFDATGKQLAFEQETVHGGIGVHYELRDVASGRLLAEYNPDPDVPGEPPRWVAELDSKR